MAEVEKCWVGMGSIMPATKQGDNMSIRMRYRCAGVAHPAAWIEHHLFTVYSIQLLTQRI